MIGYQQDGLLECSWSVLGRVKAAEGEAPWHLSRKVRNMDAGIRDMVHHNGFQGLRQRTREPATPLDGHQSCRGIGDLKVA